MIFEVSTAKDDVAKQTPVTDPSIVSGGEKGLSDTKQANKQLQPSEELGSHHPISGSSNLNEESDKTSAPTSVPPGKEVERKQNKDPDSMDLDED